MYSLIDNRYILSRGRLLCRVFHIFRRDRNILCFVPNAAARSRKTLSSVGTAAKKLKRPRLKQIPHLRRSPPQRKLPSPASGKKPKKKKAVLLVSVLALLLVAVALANSSLFQSNIAAKAEKRIVGSWNGVFLENGDDTIRAKNLGGSTCTVEKGGAATISLSERSISDLSFYLTYSPEKTKAVNDGEKLAGYCYDVKASDDPDASAFGYAFVSDDTFSVVILSDPELSFAFTASDKS